MPTAIPERLRAARWLGLADLMSWKKEIEKAILFSGQDHNNSRRARRNLARKKSKSCVVVVFSLRTEREPRFSQIFDGKKVLAASIIPKAIWT